MDPFLQMIEHEPDYNLCALYCDYHEWLDGENKPTWPQTTLDYENKMKQILTVLGKRHQPIEDKPCARCNKHGALYDGEWKRPEGSVCWPCVDAEPEPRRCAKCHLDIPEHFICDGALGEKCPNYPLEDAI